MVSVQHPAVAAAFWQEPSHNHVFAFQASAQCGPLVPQWHHHPSSSRSCVSVSNHALAGHRHHPTPGHGHDKVGPVPLLTSGGGLGDGLGSLGQALASSAAALLPQPQAHHVLMNPQTFASPVLFPLPLPIPQTIATLDPEQPIGYGSFGVVWYVYNVVRYKIQLTRCGLNVQPCLPRVALLSEQELGLYSYASAMPPS